MDTITLDQIMPVSTLQRDYKAAIRKAKQSSDSVVLVKNNKPVGLRMISEKVYTQLKKYKRMYEEEQVLRIVERGEEEYRRGETITIRDDKHFAELIGLDYEDPKH